MKQARLFALLLAICTACAAWAQDVTLRQAEGIAADFFKSRGVKSATPQKARQRAAARQNGNSPYYIFNNSDESAFVIVSGDSRTEKVLAYSTENVFGDEVTPGVECMLNQYEAYINALQDGSAGPVTRTDWGVSLSKVIETACWHQQKNFWWTECPVVNGNYTRAGCGATALAILMRYYEWPKRGFGSKTYTTKTLGLEVSADFEEIDYNWAMLPLGNENDPGWNDASKATVAKILKQCGAATNMNYSTSGSSTSVYNLAAGLYRYFGYKVGAALERKNFDDVVWYQMIVNEINSDNPILYRGVTTSGTGHLFICDGYDAGGYLHFNMGHSGVGNGFYSLLSTEDYCNEQRAVFDVRPDHNASSRTEMCDVYMVDNKKNNGNVGMMKAGTDMVKASSTFTVQCYSLQNVSDKNVVTKLAAYLCDKSGARQQQLGICTLSYDKYNLYTAPYFKCTMPADYTYSDGDYISLFTSLDDGTTWKKVECFDPKLARIDMADIYDPSAEIAKFRSGNAGILAKNADDATEDDLAAIEKALADYDSLSDKAKAELADEKARLDVMKAKIDEIVVNISAILTNGNVVKVYTVNGTLVNGNATARDLKRLAKGVYVINGKKVCVK